MVREKYEPDRRNHQSRLLCLVCRRRGKRNAPWSESSRQALSSCSMTMGGNLLPVAPFPGMARPPPYSSTVPPPGEEAYFSVTLKESQETLKKREATQHAIGRKHDRLFASLSALTLVQPGGAFPQAGRGRAKVIAPTVRGTGRRARRGNPEWWTAAASAGAGCGEEGCSGCTSHSSRRVVRELLGECRKQDPRTCPFLRPLPPFLNLHGPVCSSPAPVLPPLPPLPPLSSYLSPPYSLLPLCCDHHSASPSSFSVVLSFGTCPSYPCPTASYALSPRVSSPVQNLELRGWGVGLNVQAAHTSSPHSSLSTFPLSPNAHIF